jgi:signal transduction histidine kinase
MIVSMSERILTGVRLVLALSALLLSRIDPPELEPSGGLTPVVLALYLVFSGVLYVSSRRGRAFLSTPFIYLLDVAWYTGVILCSDGTNSIFFYLFFFAILAASFQWGCAAGLRVAVASAMLFTLLGIATILAGWDFALSRFLLRLSFLLVLSPTLAYWAGLDLAVKRRLTVLRDITRMSNPRFGIDHTLGSILEQLRAFYGADRCLLVMVDHAKGGHYLWSATRHDPERGVRAEAIGEPMARLLLALPDDHAVIYRGERDLWGRSVRREREQHYDVGTGRRTEGAQAASATIAATLDARSLVTVPLRYRDEAVGRLYLGASRGRAFTQADVDFLLQIIEYTLPTLDNIRLVDRLASDAAEEERRRIARDLHDSVIQPYIGLQLGLAAVRRKLLDGRADASADLDRLITVADTEIGDLRRYIYGLREGGEREGNLLPAVQRFATKFAEATGIAVDVEAGPGLCINDRLAAELFQMVAEGLSNVRRHTQALHASITLLRADGSLVMRIANDGLPGLAFSRFTPRSITERAAALGGCARVERDGEGGAAIVIEVPL